MAIELKSSGFYERGDSPNLKRLLTTTLSRIDATANALDHPKLQEALFDGRFVAEGRD